MTNQLKSGIDCDKSAEKWHRLTNQLISGIDCDKSVDKWHRQRLIACLLAWILTNKSLDVRLITESIWSVN